MCPSKCLFAIPNGKQLPSRGKTPWASACCSQPPASHVLCCALSPVAGTASERAGTPIPGDKPTATQPRSMEFLSAPKPALRQPGLPTEPQCWRSKSPVMFRALPSFSLAGPQPSTCGICLTVRHEGWHHQWLSFHPRTWWQVYKQPQEKPPLSTNYVPGLKRERMQGPYLCQRRLWESELFDRSRACTSKSGPPQAHLTPQHCANRARWLQVDSQKPCWDFKWMVTGTKLDDVQSHLKCTQNLTEKQQSQGQVNNPVNQSLLKVFLGQPCSKWHTPESSQPPTPPPSFKRPFGWKTPPRLASRWAWTSHGISKEGENG